MNKKHATIFLLAASALLLDQLTKLFIRNNFQLNESFPIIKNIFHITHVANTGSAFGLFRDFNLILTVISAIAVFVILYNIRNIGNKDIVLQVLAGMLLGGVAGNLIDRLAYGYVTDFIDFRIWPVFNAADSFITISIVGLIIYFWRR